MILKRASIYALVAFYSACGVSCSSSTGPLSNGLSTRTPGNSAVQEVEVNELRPTTATFATLGSGISSNIAFPITAVIPATNASNDDAILTLGFQTSLPAGIPGPQAATLGSAVTPLAYVTLKSSYMAEFWSMPAFTFTFASAPAGNLYLVAFNSANAAQGWSAIAGPLAVRGNSVTFTAPTLQQTYYANSTYAFAAVQTSAILPAQMVPMGLDYGLKRQCVRTQYPNSVNYWSDVVDCSGSTVPSIAYWLAISEIESQFKPGACIGASGQSVLFNGPGSILTQRWTGSSTSGYHVELKEDYTTTPNVCPPPSFSATGIQDGYAFDGAALPRPDEMVQQFNITYNRNVGNMGATHMSVSMGGLWSGGGAQTVVGGMQIDTWFDPGLYGPPNPLLPADILSYQVVTDPASNTTTYVIVYNGRALNPPVVTPPGTPEAITINWGTIIAHAISQGLLPAPVGGWNNSGARSQDTNIGFELENKISGPGGPMGDMVISNYRVSALLPPGSH